jgi:hypothetical protein
MARPDIERATRNPTVVVLVSRDIAGLLLAEILASLSESRRFLVADEP